MKSFSGSNTAAEHDEALLWAARAVRKNPQALFTNFQWYLYHSKNTVYFTAFSRTPLDKQALDNFVAEMVSLAPQLTHGFVGALPGQPFPKHILDAITSVTEVDELDEYPDKWLGKGLDIFERKDLPLFRVYGVTRRGGPDAQGRSAAVLVRSSHALLEGHDSSLLTRSHSIARSSVSTRPTKTRIPLKRRFGLALGSFMMTALTVILAHATPVPEKQLGFRSLAIERSRIRAVANKLGVRQRALMFGLITQALNVAEKGPEAKVISAAYTMLDNSERFEDDDDQFRVRALETKFQVKGDFVDYVRGIDQTLTEVEAKDTTTFQLMIMGMFGMMRKTARVLPFLFSDRLFRYNRSTDVVLTLVPPHRMYGNLTKSLMEPVYVGSFHPSANLCTFVPNREFITLNFAMEASYLQRVDDILTLLESTEAREPV